MSKVDWSLAPEGATHFLPAQSDAHTDIWLKMKEGIVLSVGYSGIHEWTHNYTKACQPCTNIKRAIERPKQPQVWSGPEDGLPPVGTICEARILLPGESNYLWRLCEVVYQNDEMSKSELLVVDIERTTARWADEFRAIKTEEDIARNERETAIRELMDIAQVDCRVTAARLVDAGFKREACKSDCSTNNRGVPELLGACDCR